MTKTNFWYQQAGLFLPDIGTFFNQDMALAKQLVKQLASAGVTVLKGEILQTADVCLPGDAVEQYYGHNSNEIISENYRQLIERKVIPLDSYRELFSYANNLGMKLVLSVYNFEGADFAKELNCFAIKIASSNITHQPLIEYIAKLGLPMIFDTGHTSVEEAVRAVNWAKDCGNFDLLIEHSPPAPPNDVDMHNLRFMQTLATSTGLPFGLSDHHYSDEMLYAAVALGATVVEKGVCPDNLPDEQDGGHALAISEVEAVNRKIINIQKALGNSMRELPRNRKKYQPRMGLIAKTAILPGESLSLNNVDFAFPALGIGTEHWQEVKQLTANKALNKGQIIQWQDISG